jgi:uncharacterized protein YbjT (DUF2867 family)
MPYLTSFSRVGASSYLVLDVACPSRARAQTRHGMVATVAAPGPGSAVPSPMGRPASEPRAAMDARTARDTPVTIDAPIVASRPAGAVSACARDGRPLRVLLTGANGYIGRRLLPLLVAQGHQVHCLVRDPGRFGVAHDPERGIWVHRADLLAPLDGAALPDRVDAAYYLVHSLSTSGDFAALEARAARHFASYLAGTGARQLIYLGGLGDDGALSQHLASRRHVERVLREGPVPVTVLRAGIIVGSGSASFEIIRDLTEKLPVMIAPRWLRSRTQPIAVRDALAYLAGVLDEPRALHATFDIGGPEVLTYQAMLLRYAAVRGLRRWILPVPVLTPRLSSYWLYFVTSTSYPLARNLVDSMTVDVIARDQRIRTIVPIEPITYDEAVRLAFQKIEQHSVASSWTDAVGSSRDSLELDRLVQVPKQGVYHDTRWLPLHDSPDEVLERLWRVGGATGWYHANWLWWLRGLLDRFVGGTGLRRGRRHPSELRPGDALDFWRVLVANRERGRLMLYAEMRLPGEAWLEFEIDTGPDGQPILRQTATFRPHGLAGRAYWLLVTPLHAVVFGGLLRGLVDAQPRAGRA